MSEGSISSTSIAASLKDRAAVTRRVRRWKARAVEKQAAAWSSGLRVASRLAVEQLAQAGQRLLKVWFEGLREELLGAAPCAGLRVA